MTPIEFRCLLVDPHGNPANQDAMLIYRVVYRANQKLLDLENRTLERIRTIAKLGRQDT
jgi:hypothetical protein